MYAGSAGEGTCTCTLPRYHGTLWYTCTLAIHYHVYTYHTVHIECQVHNTCSSYRRSKNFQVLARLIDLPRHPIPSHPIPLFFFQKNRLAQQNILSTRSRDDTNPNQQIGNKTDGMVGRDGMARRSIGFLIY